MLYAAYEARRALTAGMYGLASVNSAALRALPGPLADAPGVRAARAMNDTVGALKLTHRRPDFGIDSVVVGGRTVPVREEEVRSTAFGTLLRFAKPDGPPQPAVLVVPGLAGHFATLVRPTIRALLPDHDVYVTDWHNARDVPPSAGRFGLDEYIEHLMDFTAAIGPGVHLMAVCQPCVAALAAAALMAEDDHPAQPRSVILLAGPVDARVAPGPVNRFAEQQSIEALEQRAITTVPWPHRGAGRRVYPGFLQVAGFMGMDPRRHVSAFSGLFADVARGNDADADRTKAFYDEYFAVIDIAAEFYLETARKVFIEHHFARGELMWRGRKVDPSAIGTALMTIEGANDDMCRPGQTSAAHALCTGIPASRRRRHLQEGVGHYGVFSGSRFEREIRPEIASFIAAAERRARKQAVPARRAA